MIYKTLAVKTLAVGIVAATALSAGSAGAATKPVTFGYGGVDSVITIVGAGPSTCTISGYLPSQVANYTGTARLLEWTELQNVVNGQWSDYAFSFNSATIWGHSGNQLAAIYWNNQLPGSRHFSFEVGAGNARYRVVGVTQWLTGSGALIYTYAATEGFATC